MPPLTAIVPMRHSPLPGAHAGTSGARSRERPARFRRSGRLGPPAPSGEIAPGILPAVTLPSRPPPTRGRRLPGLALLLNGLLLVTGLYFEVHPRDRGDVWSAGGIAAIAVLNSAALWVTRRGDPTARVRARLRRIALIANGLLVAFGLLLALAESVRAGSRAGLPTLVLVAPPLVTILAMRGETSPDAGSGAASL